LGVAGTVGRCAPAVPEHEEKVVRSSDLFIDLRLRASDAGLGVLPADGHKMNSALARLQLVVLSDDVSESEPLLLEASRRCEEDAIFLDVTGHLFPIIAECHRPARDYRRIRIPWYMHALKDNRQLERAKLGRGGDGNDKARVRGPLPILYACEIIGELLRSII
jgi:hypothetical protein